MTILTALAARRRTAWTVLVATLLIVGGVFAVPAATPAEPESTSGLPSSFQSVQVEKLQQQLPSAGVAPALVVLARTDGARLSEADRAAVAALAERVRRFSVSPQPIPSQLAPDGTVELVLVPLNTEQSVEQVSAVVTSLRTAVGEGLPSDLTAQVTGGPAFTTDLSAVFDGADTTLLLTTALVVALLLLVTYRSPVLWIVPLIVVALAEQVTLRIVDQVLPAVGLATDGATTGITSVLVFGAATDYALLLIARYREQLRSVESRFGAMRIAVARTAEPVLASGSTVVLAVLTLLLATTEGTRALGVAAAIGIVVAMVSALVVLPCALVVCGRGLFWPFVPRFGSAETVGRLWGRLGGVVAGRPRTVAAAGAVVLVVLSLGALGAHIGLSQTEQFRVKPEAVTGAQTLAKAFPAGATDPVSIITAPSAAEQVAIAARGVNGVAQATVGDTTDRIAEVDVVLEADPGSAASYDAVRALRTVTAAVPGSEAVVGGEVASRLDLQDAAARDRLLIIPLILVLVALVLVVLLRSLLGPALLMLTVVGSFLASLGASWVLFSSFFGFPALDVGVPLLSFLFLVALGVDYNIFLVSRAREEAARHGTREGMLTALRVTGGVITSAGVLLAAVFAVLGVLPLITLTQIGVIVGVGVLLDTLLVRTVIVPALAFALGDRFWWPSRPHEATV